MHAFFLLRMWPGLLPRLLRLLAFERACGFSDDRDGVHGASLTAGEEARRDHRGPGRLHWVQDLDGLGGGRAFVCVRSELELG